MDTKVYRDLAKIWYQVTSGLTTTPESEHHAALLIQRLAEDMRTEKGKVQLIGILKELVASNEVDTTEAILIGFEVARATVLISLVEEYLPKERLQ